MNINYQLGELMLAGDADSHELFSQTGILPGDRRCQSQQSNTRTQCAKAREIDIADLQTRAFKNHKVVMQTNLQDSPVTTASKMMRASFFPDSEVPRELSDQIRMREEFQRLVEYQEKGFLEMEMLGRRPKTSQ
jgi:hypothetical protein